MTTLASDNIRPFELGDFNTFPIVADDTIYEGAAVGLETSAYRARPLTTSDLFVGFAYSQCANQGGAAGAKNVTVRRSGLVQLPVTGVTTTTAPNVPVYASDDDTFTLTESTNVQIGRVERVVGSGVAVVAFDTTRGSLGFPGLLTTSVGTASDTIADVGGSFNQGTLNNIVASLARKINQIAKQIA